MPHPAEKVNILARSTRLATRILELRDEPEYGITREAVLDAAIDVLTIGVARSEGDNVYVTERTSKILDRVLVDVEVRIAYSKLGLTHWSPA